MTTVTKSKPASLPSTLRQRLTGNLQQEHCGISAWVPISETCPRCGAKEVAYTQVQRRSADEGSTIMYRCDCGNLWDQDN